MNKVYILPSLDNNVKVLYFKGIIKKAMKRKVGIGICYRELLW
jgi:hypothetical protein